MPGLNGTGPRGRGGKTGRGQGYCMASGERRREGMGQGMNREGGRGRCNRFFLRGFSGRGFGQRGVWQNKELDNHLSKS